MLEKLNCKVRLMTDKTVLNGFPKVDIGAIIFFQEEKVIYIYNGDGEWRPLIISNNCKEHKEKEITW